MEHSNKQLRFDALKIATEAIFQMHPEKLLKQHLLNFKPIGKIHLISIGKAAWQMAEAAYKKYPEYIIDGFVITKYQHSEGEIGNLKIMEAGHPFPDENSLKTTNEVLKMVENLTENDFVLLLISGGASSLFEKLLPGVELEDVIAINQRLMNSGAGIHEINTVRKHLSAVKGGRFAELIKPAYIRCFVLSDVIGNDLDVIASGPVHPDKSTSENALQILEKYQINISEKIKKAILQETPKFLPEVETTIIGNVGDLCEKAAEISHIKGYKPIILTKKLQDDVKLAAEKLFTEMEKYCFKDKEPFALIMGGEPVVEIHGNGKGGRNQHLALLMAKKLSGFENIVFLALASDGTDGPTDASGGMVDGSSWKRFKDTGINPVQSLKINDSYNALKAAGDLVITGPTGTNVNDLILLLSY